MKKRNLTLLTAIAAAAAFASTADAAIVGIGEFVINEAGDHTRSSHVRVDSGTLTIANGSILTQTDNITIFGHNNGPTGTAVVSIESGGWFRSTQNDGQDSSRAITVGNQSNGIGHVLVTGTGSKFTTAQGNGMRVGRRPGTSGTIASTMTIDLGGLVLTDSIQIGGNGGEGYVRMGVGGMLAILGDRTADVSTMVDVHANAISPSGLQYDNGGTWENIAGASTSLYDLTFYNSSTTISGVDVNGYTVLTMIPEPSSLGLLALGGLVLLRRRRA